MGEPPGLVREADGDLAAGRQTAAGRGRLFASDSGAEQLHLQTERQGLLGNGAHRLAQELRHDGRAFEVHHHGRLRPRGHRDAKGH